MSYNDMYKVHKHLDLDSLSIIFKYLKQYFGRVRTINGVLPDEHTGNVDIDVSMKFDLIYPVGSVYLSVSSVSPNTLFPGTTWTRLESGKFLMAASDISRAGVSGGVDNQTYTIPLPKHTHTVASVSEEGAHTHDRGSMNITGGFCGAGYTDDCAEGAFSVDGQGAVVYNKGDRDNYYRFEAAKEWTGVTSENGAHTHEITINEAGTGNTVKIEPPYFTVNVWQRVV